MKTPAMAAIEQPSGIRMRLIEIETDIQHNLRNLVEDA
jgi:hypothetical protein